MEHIDRVVKNVDSGSVHPVLALFRRRVKHKWTIDVAGLFRAHPKPKQSLWTLPEQSFRKKMDPQLPRRLNVYLTALFLQQITIFLLQRDLQLTLGPELFLRQLLFFWAMSSLGRLLDGFGIGKGINTFRVLVCPFVIAWFIPNDSLLYYGSIVDLVVFMGISMSLVGTKH